MSLSSSMKLFVEELPEGVARPLSKIPYTIKLGPTYTYFSYQLRSKALFSKNKYNKYVIEKLNDLFLFSNKNNSFYEKFYKSNGVRVDRIESLKDWENLPIATKADFQSEPLRNRLTPNEKGQKINTGGTSGQPLEFYLDRKAFAREWAHMHFIWRSRGYHPSQIKVTFRGKHFGGDQALKYNAVHNEYVVNASVCMEEVVRAVLLLQNNTLIRWLHGYPSLVAEFAHAVSKLPCEDVEKVRGSLFGVLLGSEYPAQMYRMAIESTLSTNVVSWYGHSEMSLLAREITRGVYQSLPTYGFAEAVPTEDGKAHRLVCTSLYNRVHPFIRYDTGDLIEPISQVDGCLTFRIKEGRVGDFIEDRDGKRHSLTAIIFGRHHEAFGQLQHLQVRDEGNGVVSLVVTPKDFSVTIDTLKQGFNLEDLPVDWRIEKVTEPVRTAAGKIKLKI